MHVCKTGRAWLFRPGGHSPWLTGCSWSRKSLSSRLVQLEHYWNLRNATTHEWDQILKITVSRSFLLDQRGLSCWTWLCLPYLYHSCLHLPGQSPIYLWKFSEGESHAMSMIKRSADHIHLLFTPLTSLHTCPDLPDQSPIYLWKQEDNDFHATFLIKQSADHFHP